MAATGARRMRRAGILFLACGLLAAGPAGAAERAFARIHVAIAEGHGRPYELPRAGELQVNTSAWRTVALPHIEYLDTATPNGLALRVDGYEAPDTATVTLLPGADTDLVFRLTPRPVPVTIQCSTPGAVIYEGQAELGHPGEAIWLPAFCQHQLVIRAPRHQDGYASIAYPDPAAPPPDMRVDLVPLPGDLRLLVRHAERLRHDTRGRISLDGTLVADARLPYVLAGLTQAVATVELQVPGFKRLEPRTVAVVPGALTDVEFDLEHEEAFLEFDVVPTNAVIMVAGWRVTSNEMRVIPDLLYSVHVEAPGHRAATLVESARAGERHAVYLELDPLTFLSFELTPPEAVVFMGGRRLTERFVEINPGQEYVIDIRAPHHQSVTVRATAERGETRVIQANLKRRRFE